MGWLRNLVNGVDEPGPATARRVHAVEAAPPVPLPDLSPEWQEYAGRLLAALTTVDEAGSPFYFMFQPDDGASELHVGVGRITDGPGPAEWIVSNSGVPFPPEALPFFSLDENGWWSPATLFGREDAARAAAVLLSYIYPSPAHVQVESWEHTLLTQEVEDALIDSLTGDQASPLPQSGPGRGPQPEPRLIRTPHDAELVAAEWVRWFGYTNVGVTRVGPDSGIDVFSDQVIGQVKMEGVPTGRPVIQNAYGVAAAEDKTAIVFSLGGYVRNAIEWADKVSVPLFQFDLQGTPVAINAAARSLMTE